MKIITSTNNGLVKTIRLLKQKKYRDRLGLFLLEGEKNIIDALRLAKDRVQDIIVSKSKQQQFAEIIKTNEKIIYIVDDSIYKTLSDTKTPQGILAVIKKPVQDVQFVADSPFLVLDRLQDPGNMGTIIRTAVAAGFNKIITINTVDPYSEKVVRSSASSILLAKIYDFSISDFVDWANVNKPQLLVAKANEHSIFDRIKLTKNYGLLIGNEGQGVSSEILSLDHTAISIPMKSDIESLNAGVSAAIIMYTLANKK